MRASQFDTRKSGISSVGELPWGSHLCQFYDTKNDLIDVLVPYLRAGLENNEFCSWVVHAPLSVEEAQDALKQAVPRLPEYLETGQIEILPSALWAPLESEASRAIIAKLDQAVTRGFDGLRLACPALPVQQGSPPLPRTEARPSPRST